MGERTEAKSIIQVKGFTAAYGERAILKDLTFDVMDGEVFIILGGSGCGKSTVLKHMIGLLRPDSGRVLVAGTDVSEYSERAWVDVRKQFGYVFQGAALFDSLSVAENIAYPLREHLKWSEEQIATRVAECLAALSVGKTNTALGAFYRRLAARVGKAKAITATARKLAVLFYNTLRYGTRYVDPGADFYQRRYKQRVFDSLKRRARSLGYEIVPAADTTG